MNGNSRQKYNLTEGRIPKSIWILAWPMVLGNLLQNLFNIVDMIFVGRLGPNAIGAVAMSGILMSVVWTFLAGVSMGTRAMVSRFFGAGDTEQTKIVVYQSLILGVVLSVLLAVLGHFFAAPALKALGGAPDVVRLGTPYLKIVFLGSFALIIFFLISSVLRGIGDALTPMKVWAFATVLNIVLDPILIFGLGPAPKLGVRGAAIATVTGQGIGMLIGLWILFRGVSFIQIHLREFRLNLDIIWRIIKIAIPGSVQGGVRSLGDLFIMRIVAVYGTVAVAAYGVGLRVLMIIMLPGWALGSTAATLVGLNLGAKKPDRAEKSTRYTTAYYLLFVIPMGILFFAFPEWVIRIFNSDPDVLRIGAEYLRITTLAYPFLAIGLITGMAQSGAGDTTTPMLVITTGIFAVQIPLALLLPRFLSLGTNGIWLAIACAYSLQGILMAYFFWRGKWKRKKV
ncbi:MAG: MATE family efflux transporter [Calditrichaeota bacterium]|nr:MATE family efflux transporter [Calditrichota bacterium]